MPPTLIPAAARPRQYVLWRQDFDPSLAHDQDCSGRPDAVFVAIQPPADIAEDIYRLGMRIHCSEKLNCSPVLPRCLHLTLLGVGHYLDLSYPAFDRLLRALAKVAMPSFRFALNRAVSFDNKSNWPFVLVGDDSTTPGIHMLRAKLVDALHEVGFRLGAPSLTPHMTLFRAGRRLDEYAIDEIGWTVREFVLIHSLQGQHEHKVLGRRELQSSANRPSALTAPAP